MKKLLYTLALLLMSNIVLAQTDSENYVKNVTYKKEVKTQAAIIELDDDDIIKNVTYLDGLGRPIQSVAARAGGQREDIITPIVYDAFGRQLLDYLPHARSYQSSSDPLSFELPEQLIININSHYLTKYHDDFIGLSVEEVNPFSEKVVETSPLGRILEQAAPGKDWAIGNNHTIKFAYKTNGIDEVKRFAVFHPSNNTEKTNLIFEGYFNQNQLYKTITKDENWTEGNEHTTEEFKNKQGQVILKRTYNKGELYDTYYVYDDFGNLTYVLPPEASEDIVLNGNAGFRAASQTNYSWVDLVSVDKNFADDYNKNLKDYDNENILNIDIENEYGGQGGFTVTTFLDSEFIELNINFSATKQLELKQGELISLKDYGDYEDTELGVIKGSEYEYYFGIVNNAIYVKGGGQLDAVNQIFNSSQVLDYSLNYTWPMLVNVDPEYAHEFDEQIRTYAKENELNPLDVYVENEFGAQGGLQVSVDEFDNVSFSFNITSSSALSLKKEFAVKLDLKRSLEDKDLGAISGQGFGYNFFLKENTLYANATETSNFTAFNGFTFSSGQNSGGDINIATVEGLCYIYHYDSRNRLIEKKIPGKGWEHIVYDKLDRPIFTQDAKQRLNYKWLYTKYDVLGRVIYTGNCKFGPADMTTENAGRLEIQTMANAQTTFYESDGSTTINGLNIPYTNEVLPLDSIELFTVNYYDDYSFGVPNELDYNNENLALNTKSLPTGNHVRVLDTEYWITTVTYYDDKAQPIYVASENAYLNTIDVVEYNLDFTGKPRQITTSHTKDSNRELIVKSDFTYDHMGRLLIEKQKVNNEDTELITNNHYDKFGQLVSKDVGGALANIPEQSAGLQTINYDYNIRGWLKSINHGVADANNLFGFKLNYNTTNLSGATALFNGNISETYWQVNGENSVIQKAYNYSYDALNRIKSGTFHKLSGGPAEDYSLNHVSYDKNGNILNLMRSGTSITNSEEDGIPIQNISTDYIDKLTYSYEPNSNQLNNVNDNANKDGFKDGTNRGNDYLYDINGNMTQDLNKDIIAIEYNHLNLPTKIVIEGEEERGSIGYVYDATGVKLKKEVNDYNAATTKSTHYAGNYIYEQDTEESQAILKFFSHSEGYVEPNEDYKFDYVYQYKDHLGNIRLSYSDANNNGTIEASTEILQERNYYPFGTLHQGYNNVINGTENNHKTFAGKELNKELGLDWYDFGARNYDAALGRWMNLDPLAENYSAISPYVYALNNPLHFIDPDGRDVKNADEERRKIAEKENTQAQKDLGSKANYLGVSANASRKEFKKAAKAKGGKAEWKRTKNTRGVASKAESKLKTYTKRSAITQKRIDDFKKNSPKMFAAMDNIQNQYGETVDVMVGVDNMSGYNGKNEYMFDVNAAGEVRQKSSLFEGGKAVINTVNIFLNQSSVMGPSSYSGTTPTTLEVTKHEMGHANYEIQNTRSFQAYYNSLKGAAKALEGHNSGNPSGINAALWQGLIDIK